MYVCMQLGMTERAVTQVFILVQLQHRIYLSGIPDTYYIAVSRISSTHTYSSSCCNALISGDQSKRWCDLSRSWSKSLGHIYIGQSSPYAHPPMQRTSEMFGSALRRRCRVTYNTLNTAYYYCRQGQGTRTLHTVLYVDALYPVGDRYEWKEELSI